MSSQGPRVSGTVAINGNPVLNSPSPSSTLTAGYSFDKDSVRDAGDWIRLKRELIVFKEDKTKNFHDPWFVRSNGYRLTWMQGRSKQVNEGTCVPCVGAAFTGNGPF